MTQPPVGLLLVLAVVGILLAAALSASEVAVLRVTRAAVTELYSTRHAAADRVRKVVEHPVRVSSSAAFVRLLCEMTATVCLTLIVASSGWPWWTVLIVAGVLCALVAYLLVRVSPRTLGRQHPVTVLVAFSRLLLVVSTVVGGFARAAPAGRTVEAEDELRDMVQRVSESDVIEDDERDMFRSVLELGDTLTREVMVPRTDMVTTGADTPLRKAQSLLLRSGYSRVPVVGDSVDDLRGVLYLKDLVRRLADDPQAASAPAASIARPPVFVPESKPVDQLLREMQAGSSHIAIVVDEYGGIAGLVTIEDALEEIVGELTDEHDRSGPAVEDLGDGVIRVPARLGKDELGELFGLQVEDDDVDSAGGLLAKALGKVPLPGSVGEIHGLHLVAEQAGGRRKQIITILASRITRDDEADEPDDHDDFPSRR
ncbi:hemolysin family protein [Cellulomonas chengniuliangii]|uniref:Hemolysin family protein n=1 Tax=Cellulomonas chengniuliangii TaxID=2968084 RepID=A0ABY5L3P7_9CELL|nr:hemolysin family protein [Cellulomonas chengniuliangii]MCC2308032.1 hemolysin family protein [Cellulomonas chengniuliangii]MCC2318254.1 hemolysin family protein [Cellulomonas chengniuliangii]UUI76434.1 hemolysin family protein [Cellulomonas chengniuliangii]